MRNLHPFQEPSEISLRVSADAVRAGNTMRFHFEVEGDLHQIVLPASDSPQRKDGLWNSTCFEAFVSSSHKSEYWELNTTSAGDWNVFYFESYRSPKKIETSIQEVNVVSSHTDNKLCVQFELTMPKQLSLPAQCNLAAIIELHQGQTTFWALNHPRSRPDFHTRECFVLTID